MDGTEDIYQKHGEMVYKYVMSLCQNPDTAEDLTQETFYQALKHIEKYDGSCKVSTWLCSIARHLWYRELDRQRRKGTKELDEYVIASSGDPENIIVLADEKMRVMKCIHQLRADEREVVMMRLFGELSFGEIAEVLGKRENWARVTFYRAKEKVRRCMENEM